MPGVMRLIFIQSIFFLILLLTSCLSSGNSRQENPSKFSSFDAIQDELPHGSVNGVTFDYKDGLVQKRIYGDEADTNVFNIYMFQKSLPEPCNKNDAWYQFTYTETNYIQFIYYPHDGPHYEFDLIKNYKENKHYGYFREDKTSGPAIVEAHIFEHSFTGTLDATVYFRSDDNDIVQGRVRLEVCPPYYYSN